MLQVAWEIFRCCGGHRSASVLSRLSRRAALACCLWPLGQSCRVWMVSRTERFRCVRSISIIASAEPGIQPLGYVFVVVVVNGLLRDTSTSAKADRDKRRGSSSPLLQQIFTYTRTSCRNNQTTPRRGTLLKNCSFRQAPGWKSPRDIF